jgi:hypothetical protein
MLNSGKKSVITTLQARRAAGQADGVRQHFCGPTHHYLQKNQGSIAKVTIEDIKTTNIQQLLFLMKSLSKGRL